MRKVIPIVLIGMVVLSGLGAGAYSIEQPTTQPSCVEDFDMVIIAPEKFSTRIQPLIDHKNDRDVQTFLKTTEEVYSEFAGRDGAEKIKYFIKDDIESWNISYVLLVGGANQLP